VICVRLAADAAQLSGNESDKTEAGKSEKLRSSP